MWCDLADETKNNVTSFTILSNSILKTKYNSVPFKVQIENTHLSWKKNLDTRRMIKGKGLLYNNFGSRGDISYFNHQKINPKLKVHMTAHALYSSVSL